MDNGVKERLNKLYLSLNIDDCFPDKIADSLVNIIPFEFNKVRENTFKELICKYFKCELSKEGLDFYIKNGLNIERKAADLLINFFQGDKIGTLRKKYNVIFLDNIDKLVSIIITTHNRKNMLPMAIDSVLDQTYKNIEIIVMDDCSTDGTEDVIKDKYGNISSIRYYKNEINKGCGTTRLNAFKEFCHGKYVVFMDDDDYFIDNDYFLKAVNLHEKYKNLSFVAPSHFIHDYKNHKVDYIDLKCPDRINNKEYFINFNYKYTKPIASSTIFNKTSLDNTEFCKMGVINDTTIFIRSLLDGDAGFIDTVGLVYRLHGNNITYNLTCDFIIENLLEKIHIKNLGIRKFDFKSEEMDEWLDKQLNITIYYYLGNSKVTFTDCAKLLLFLKNNTKSYYKHSKFKIVKSGIRNLLKQRRSNES